MYIESEINKLRKYVNYDDTDTACSTHKNYVSRTILGLIFQSIFLFSLRWPTTGHFQMIVYKLTQCFLGPLFIAKLCKTLFKK